MTGHARIDEKSFKAEAPAAYKALLDLGKAVDEAGIEKSLIELVKLRASQMNGCAYCLQLHLNMARKLGLPAAKLDLLAVWQEAAGIYSDREQAALAWTEALTAMAAQCVSDEVYRRANQVFDEPELVFLTSAIANINAWNRIAGALHWTPPIPKAGAG